MPRKEELIAKEIDYQALAESELDNLLELSRKQLEFSSLLKKISSYCISEGGREIINSLRPIENVDELRYDLDCIYEMYQIQMENENIPLEGITEIRDSLNKSTVSQAFLSPIEILDIAEDLRVFRLIHSFFDEREELYPSLKEFSSGIAHSRLLEKHISDAIDETGFVRDNATRELSNIRRELNEKSNRLRSRLQKILRKVSDEDLIQEDFFTMREGRFVLPVKAENKRIVPGIIHGLSQTGSTVFIEPSEIIEMNNDLSLLRNEEEREVIKILTTLTAEIGSQADEFLHSFEILSRIDSISARARYAVEFGGEKPEITDEAMISLSNIRHPLLVQSKGTKNVIPLNIDFEESKRGYLISGPNAGGKTVALKSIGLAVSMALSGIFPLGSCKTNFRHVFTYIGDNQSIESDLSTFSSQMIQLKKIIENCSDKSLILVDEIGSGTDPQEGAALASGILDTFIEFRSFFIATTHQSSLKTYALSRDVISNASLEFNEEELKPTYKFLSDIPGNSYAFFLAKNIGLSQEVIKRSNKYLGGKQKELEKSISILQKYRLEAVKTRVATEKERIELAKLRLDYEKKHSEISRKRKELVDDARQEAYDILEKANALVENTIREIREDKRKVSDIKNDFNTVKQKLKERVRKSEYVKEVTVSGADDLNVGDKVKMIDSDSVGYIQEIDKKTETAMVDFHGMNFKVKINKLEKTKIKEAKIPTPPRQFAKTGVSSSLDLRGMRADECLAALDEFLSDSILAGIEILTIIHGKGTGALREVVHQSLKHNPSVKSFRLGELVEGGAGATIVTI